MPHSTRATPRAHPTFELSPVLRLAARSGGATRRTELQRTLAQTRSHIRGDTGLYDTTLAAYRQMVRTDNGGYVNSVVIMTGGVNDDTTGGISLATLLSTLRREWNPDRPVRILTIGMGEADAKALRAISQATGSTSYIADTGGDIDRVLVEALRARPHPRALSPDPAPLVPVGDTTQPSPT